MKIYRATLKPISSYSSPVQSDTVFGAFCWAYRYIFGEELLLDFLALYRIGTPSIIFSNAFPEGYLPLPVGMKADYLHERPKERSARREWYKKNKCLKKRRYAPFDEFNGIINKAGCCTDNVNTSFSVNDTVYGNSINRIYNTVNSDGNEAGIFPREVTYPKGNLEMYLKINEGFEEITERVLRVALEMGIGADKSIGKGIFELETFEVFDSFKIPEKANCVIVMSNYIPAYDDPVEGRYKTLVKYGRHDREYAAGAYPFKKPLLMITEGSVFFTDDIKEYYGRAVDNISAIDSGIIQCGYAFVMPAMLD